MQRTEEYQKKKEMEKTGTEILNHLKDYTVLL